MTDETFIDKMKDVVNQAICKHDYEEKEEITWQKLQCKKCGKTIMMLRK